MINLEAHKTLHRHSPPVDRVEDAGGQDVMGQMLVPVVDAGQQVERHAVENASVLGGQGSLCSLKRYQGSRDDAFLK